MSNAIIYVFSGTYHTLKTAEMLKNHLEIGNVPTSVHEVRQPLGSIPTPEDGDIVGFGYPVHAFNAPRLFLRFVRSLPEAQHNRAFIFKTSGEPFRINDASSYKLYKTLRKKGYDVVLETHMLMPYNILRRYPDGLVKQMTLYSDAQCKLLALRLLNGERDTLRYTLRHRLASVLFRIEWFGAWFNGMFYGVDMKKCTRCQLCVKSCPAENITYDGNRFHFARECTMCMRCAMYCPKDAVHVGLIQPWKVNGGYTFSKILADPNIAADFINAKTKGYFGLFKKFFRKADEMLLAYGITIPGHSPVLSPEPPELKVIEEYEAELADYSDEQHQSDSISIL
jgi:ferredoxin/flavodoxin